VSWFLQQSLHSYGEEAVFKCVGAGLHDSETLGNLVKVECPGWAGSSWIFVARRRRRLE